jgi:hypothetical protein
MTHVVLLGVSVAPGTFCSRGVDVNRVQQVPEASKYTANSLISLTPETDLKRYMQFVKLTSGRFTNDISAKQKKLYYTFFFNLCGGTFGTAATTGLLYQPRMIGDGDLDTIWTVSCQLLVPAALPPEKQPALSIGRKTCEPHGASEHCPCRESNADSAVFQFVVYLLHRPSYPR